VRIDGIRSGGTAMAVRRTLAGSVAVFASALLKTPEQLRN